MHFSRLIPAIVLLAGCKYSNTGPYQPPAQVQTIKVIAPTGTLQGTVNTMTGPFAVQVHDSTTGSALAGVTVNWTVSQGHGSLQAAMTTTDSVGIATNTMTLDRHPGPAEITASLGNTSAVRFTVVAVPGPVATVQSAIGRLPGVQGGIDTVAVFVADEFGNGVAQARVHFLTTDGVVRDTVVDTDGHGRAFTQWFLPVRAGPVTATAIVVPLAPVNFTTTLGTSSAATIRAVSPTGVVSSVAGTPFGPLTVHVQDSVTGQPVFRATVTWTQQGPGVAPPTTSTTTNQNGDTAFLVTLDGTPGLTTVTASLDDGRTATFQAQAMAGSN